ncbi:MAG: hypothetical protein ACJAVA_000347 [Flavobacteriaceae bacterium]|jgi:hypothetical protein
MIEKYTVIKETKTLILALTKAFFILLVMCCFSCNVQPVKKYKFSYEPLLDSTTGNNSIAIGMSALSNTIQINVCKHSADWYHPTSDSMMCNDSLWIK